MPTQSLLTWNQAEQELLYRLGNRSDLGSGSSDRAAMWLNAAQLTVAASVIACEDLDQIAWPLSTVSGQSEYSLISVLPPATNVIGIRVIRNTSQGVMMQRFPWYEYRSLSQQAQGQPLRWARFGYVLAFDPQPNDVYEIIIDYRRQPQLNTVEIPSQFQNDWITVAEWIGWKALMKPANAQAAFALLPQNLQRLVSQPMDRDEWESMWDTNQVIAPWGFQSQYTVVP